MKQPGDDRIWPFAEGGGTTIIFFTLIAGFFATLWYFYINLLTGILFALAFALWLLILYFFRDPNRTIPKESGLVLSPGDGEIMEIIRQQESQYLYAEVIRISMFLSITNVHVQRAPISGKVTHIDHQPGKFLQAFKPEASDVNERISMVIESEYGRVLVRQIAGILARRCVNYAEPGDEIKGGQRFGLIKFSSRIDLFLPVDSRLLVKVGDKVYGGTTSIAQLKINRTH